jgi:hypothetical protein
MDTSPPGYRHVDAGMGKPHSLDYWTQKPLDFNTKTTFRILDLIFVLFFGRLAAPALARPIVGCTGFTTVFEAVLLVGLSLDAATAGRT